METLLCRRLELFRASGQPIEETDPTVLGHLDECLDCRHAVELDQAIAEALCQRSDRVPNDVRRRIEVLVAVKSQPVQSMNSKLGSWLMVAASAVMLVVMGIGLGTMSSGQEPSSIISDVLKSAEPFSGVRELVALHAGNPSAASEYIPNAAVLYRARLPVSLVNTLLVDHSAKIVDNTQGQPMDLILRDATLFVLDKSRIKVDPGIDAALQQAGSLTLPWGTHQITVSTADGKLFVIIASSDGIMTAAN